MRLRIPELLQERQLTPYRLSKLSGGRISLSAIHRLHGSKGRAQFFDAALLDALYEVLKLESLDQLLEPNQPQDREEVRSA